MRDGNYTLVKCEGEPVNSQEALYQEAYDKAAERTAAREAAAESREEK